MILYVYLAKRDNVSFIKAVGIGIVGLLPFIFWVLFSTFYYGFPVPNTAYVKLGTDLPKLEYIKRGIQYFYTSAAFDPLLFVVPLFMIVFLIFVRKFKYIYCSLGVILYMAYVMYIGGDFMVGRHFTVPFFMALICLLDMQNHTDRESLKVIWFNKTFYVVVILSLLLCFLCKPFTERILFGSGSSPIADERDGYFKYTSLYSNLISYIKNHEMVIRDAWNEQGIDEVRAAGNKGAILVMVPGISIYYNSDLYLNDLYALGDPFLSKLPAVREENWRIGHMWREAPVGYNETVLYGENVIEDENLREYYEIIKLITRGKLFDAKRIKAVIDINLGKYDYLLDNYKNSLDENCHQITDKYYVKRGN